MYAILYAINEVEKQALKLLVFGSLQVLWGSLMSLEIGNLLLKPTAVRLLD